MGGEEAVNMGVNMGGGCGVCTPPPPHTIIQLIRGGGTPQNLMGGLYYKSKHGNEESMEGA